MMADQLSDKARELLTAALAADGRRKGLIVMTELRGNGVILLAGNDEQRLFGEDANPVWQSRYELLDRNLVVEFTVDGSPAGLMVTPLGCLAAGWTAGG